MTTVIERRVHRRGTAAAWTAANPVLLAGEVGYETDTHKTKLGDGATDWVTLPYDAPNATVLSSTFVLRSQVDRPVNVGFVGDSITDAQSGPDAGGLADRWSGITSFGGKSIPFWALQFSQGLYTYGGVWATFGLTAAGVRANWLPAVVAAKPDVCVVLAGTNAGTSLAQDITDLTAIYNELAAAGIRPVCATIPPKGIGPVADNSPQTNLNTWIRRYARLNRLPLADYYAALVDPTTGAYQTAFDSGDHIHPSGAGAKAMGLVLAAALIADLSGSVAADLGCTDGGNVSLLTPHPLNLTSDWGAMAGIGTGTITYPVVAGVKGKMLTLTRGDTDINVAGWGMTLIAGHRYSVAFWSSFTAAGSQLHFRWENTGGVNWLWSWDAIDLDMGLGLRQFEFVVPAGLPSYTYRPRLQLLGGAGGVFAIGQYTAQDLTANGIA